MKPEADDTVAAMFASQGRALLLYARQWVDAAAAEDVVQRVFVRLLSARRLPDDPRTWLFRCVRNEAISVWRTDRRRGRREQSVAAGKTEWFVPGPEDRVDAHEAEEALRELPVEQREIVTLRIWSALTLAQIAQVTGFSIATVHNHYRAALKTMRERLESPCRNRKT